MKLTTTLALLLTALVASPTGFAAPPNVPADRLAALRKAFDDTMADKEFLTEAEKIGLEITPVSGQKIQELVAEVYRNTTPEIAKKIAEMLK